MVNRRRSLPSRFGNPVAVWLGLGGAWLALPLVWAFAAVASMIPEGPRGGYVFGIISGAWELPLYVGMLLSAADVFLAAYGSVGWRSRLGVFLLVVAACGATAMIVWQSQPRRITPEGIVDNFFDDPYTFQPQTAYGRPFPVLRIFDQPTRLTSNGREVNWTVDLSSGLTNCGVTVLPVFLIAGLVLGILRTAPAGSCEA